MGRSRRGPALRMATAASSPSSRMCWSAPSTSRMAFLVTSPMSRMRPMSDPMLMEPPVRPSPRKAPTRARGRASMMVKGWTSDSNWLASTMKMKSTATSSAKPMLAWVSSCSFCMPSQT